MFVNMFEFVFHVLFNKYIDIFLKSPAITKRARFLAFGSSVITSLDLH
jgi:hypothetical protein